MIDFGWFHILRPVWLFAIPAVLLFTYIWKYYPGAAISGITLIDPHLRQVMTTGQSRKAKLPLYCLLSAILLSVVALSGPGWSNIDKPVQQSQQATFIVLDLSYSMSAEDTKPSRYRRAQFKIADMLKRFSNQGLFALIAYAGDAYLVTPLTEDVQTMLNFIDDVYPGILPTVGSRPESAFAMIADIEQANALHHSRVLLVTDGVTQTSSHAISALVRQYGLSLYILAIGKKSGVPISTEDGHFLKLDNGELAFANFDPDSLQQLANETQGSLARLTVSDDDLHRLFGDSLVSQTDATVNSSETEKVPADQGYLLLLLILPLTFICMRRGVMLALVLMICLPGEVRALDWNDTLWQNQEYQAKQKLLEQQYNQAYELSDDPNTRGAALYRQKRYQQALALFDKDNTATGHYNAGNSLMQIQQYAPAIERYQTALTQVADNTQLQQSIEKNLAIARRLLEQQQQQNQHEENQQQQNTERQQQDQEQNTEQQEQNAEQQGQNQKQRQATGQQQQSQQLRPQNEQTKTQRQQQRDSASQEQHTPQSSENKEAIRQQIQQQENKPDDNKQEPQQSTVTPRQQQNSELRSREELLLNIVKDRPGELLRQKFQLQQQRRPEKNSNDPL